MLECPRSEAPGSHAAGLVLGLMVDAVRPRISAKRLQSITLAIFIEFSRSAPPMTTPRLSTTSSFVSRRSIRSPSSFISGIRRIKPKSSALKKNWRGISWWLCPFANASNRSCAFELFLKLDRQERCCFCRRIGLLTIKRLKPRLSPPRSAS